MTTHTKNYSQTKTAISTSLLLLLLGACSNANGSELNNSSTTNTSAVTGAGDMETYSEDNIQYGYGQRGRGRCGRYWDSSQGDSSQFQGAGRRFNRGAPGTMLLRTALNIETLSNAQRGAIRALIDDQMSSVRPASKRFDPEFQSQLADAIRSGNVDDTLFSKHQETMDEAREKHVANQNKILDSLHDTLSEAQRITLAERIRTQMPSQGDVGRRYRSGKGRGGQGQGRFQRRQYSSDENTGFGRPNGRGRGIFGLAQGLDLTAEQRAAIDEIFEKNRADRPSAADRSAKREEMRKCHEAFLDAFVTDAFDAATHRCPRFSDEERESRRLRRTEGMNELIQILTDSQRSQLAEQILTAASFGPF